MQQRLLSEADLTFKKMLELAQGLEAAHSRTPALDRRRPKSSRMYRRRTQEGNVPVLGVVKRTTQR